MEMTLRAGVGLARRLEQPVRASGRRHDRDRDRDRQQPPPPRGRRRPLRPTRGPQGEVRWWERPPPGGDDRLWAAVQRLQVRRLQLGVTVVELARRLGALGHPISRETLSRVLNGKQPTSWATVQAMAEALSADLPDDPRGDRW